jgi:hypothetical protein
MPPIDRSMPPRTSTIVWPVAASTRVSADAETRFSSSQRQHIALQHWLYIDDDRGKDDQRHEEWRLARSTATMGNPGGRLVGAILPPTC